LGDRVAGEEAAADGVEQGVGGLAALRDDGVVTPGGVDGRLAGSAADLEEGHVEIIGRFPAKLISRSGDRCRRSSVRSPFGRRSR
jgi:hypothetical protein